MILTYQPEYPFHRWGIASGEEEHFRYGKAGGPDESPLHCQIKCIMTGQYCSLGGFTSLLSYQQQFDNAVVYRSTHS